MTGGSIMVNELRKNTSINADLQVDGLAAFGIAAIVATSFCICIGMGMKYGYTFHFGVAAITPPTNLLPTT